MEELKKRLNQVLGKDEWTHDEEQWLLQYLEQTESPELRSLMFDEFRRRDALTQSLNKETSAEILKAIHEKIGIKKTITGTPVLLLWHRKMIAAAVIGIFMLSTYLVADNKHKGNISGIHPRERSDNQIFKNDIAPGGNKALLTLANGSTILLDDARDGTLAQQGKTMVSKTDGKLTYNGGKTGTDEVLYNTVTTPRGGEYQVILPDGSQVWLNAASSLRFPTAFKGNERRVNITGEAYFEVAKNPGMPFIVKVNNAEIKVFGTHFNVMAYGEEQLLKTTLLEGSIQFTSGNNQTMLKPGQQSQLVANGQVKVLDDVDLDEVVAWKNGMFHFEKIDAKTMMRQIARWYDVEVVYEDHKTDERFYADIPRNTNLLDVLKALELTGKIQFNVEGRTVMVK